MSARHACAGAGARAARRVAWRAFALLFALFLAPLATLAQEPRPAPIEVEVLGVEAVLVRIDAGSLAGLRAGDRVLLYPPGRPAVEAVVRLVEQGAARVEPLGPREGLAPGVRGEAFASAAAERAEDGPALPWKHPLEAWDPDAPLLAPAKATPAEERPARFHGRSFLYGQYVDDREGAGREYASTRAGVDLEAENLFGDGGLLEAQLEWSARSFDTGAEDGSEDRLRVERLSYVLGGRREDPNRLEVGRFLQHGFPELGLLDGVEYTARRARGDLFGASFGYLPEPFDELETGEDLQASVYYRYVAGEDERAALALAYQKSWHGGEADRDLLVLKGEWHPFERFSLWATTWLDWYGPGDERDGLELSQAQANAHYRFEGGHGLSLSLSHLKWPELLRDELPPATLETLADGEVTRAALSGHARLGPRLRLGARADRWEDEEADGGGGELSLGLRDVLWRDGELRVALFDQDTLYARGQGLRLSADRRLGAGVLRLDLETADWEQAGVLGEAAELAQQRARLWLDTRFLDHWSLALWVEQRFGDEQDSTAAGFHLQRRF